MIQDLAPARAGLDPSTATPPTRGESLLAYGLGWFSIGLGMAELLAPRALARLIGVSPQPALFRFLGLRELTSGLGILRYRRPVGALWSRVVGDAMDLSLLGNALTNPKNDAGRLAGAIAAVAGVGALDLLAAVRHTREAPALRSLRVVKTIAINRSPEECYTFWRDLERLPRFMVHVESVEVLDATRSRWVVKGPAGKKVRWEAELTRDEPGRVIGWRTLAGADVTSIGVVQFEPRPNGQGTLLRVGMEYAPPMGKLGALVATLFLEAPEQQLKDDLRRVKQLLETGEVPTTEGQPAGRRTLGHRAMAKLFTGGVS
jgi:uncharacterized membrane protein